MSECTFIQLTHLVDGCYCWIFMTECGNEQVN